MAIDLARKMNIPESEMIHMYRGVMLHDIGKIGIPLSAQLFTIVDVWDALTSDPSYRPAW